MISFGANGLFGVLIQEIIMHVLIHCKLLERNLNFFLVTDINTVSNYCSGEEYLLSISRSHIDEMIAHALHEHPNECCGVLVGVDDVVSNLYRITNKAASSYRYLMDPQEFLEVDQESEKKGQEILAFYHSHTHSDAYPSQTDVRMALESGWQDVYYVLVSLMDKVKPDIRAFHINDDGNIVEENIVHL